MAGLSAASPVATAWQQTAPERWLSEHEQVVSRWVGDFTITVTFIRRFPMRTVPCQPVVPALASVTIPLSRRDFPSLNACHEAALLKITSVQPLIVARFFSDTTCDATVGLFGEMKNHWDDPGVIGI